MSLGEDEIASCALEKDCTWGKLSGGLAVTKGEALFPRLASTK